MSPQLRGGLQAGPGGALRQQQQQLYRASPARQRRRAAPCRAAPQQQLPVYIEDASTSAFLDWARSAGVSFAKLRPAAFGGVRGMAAASEVGVDDLLVSVPRAVALTLPPRQRCPCADFVRPAYWDESPWFVRLGVRLLDEQRKGAASPYAAWLQQLPARVNTPVNWSRELVQQLQYAHIIHKVTEQQRQWGELYDKFRDEGVVDKARAPSKQEFFRALSLVRSRTFSGPYVASSLRDRLRLSALVAALVAANTLAGGDLSKGLGAAAAVFLFNVIYELVLSNRLRQYAMCPVVDFLNHSSSKTTEVSYDYPRDAFLVTSASTYAPGEQVFISYGAQTNDSLMQLYGFAEPDNPFDVFVTTSLLKWLEQLAPVSQARLDRLNQDGLLPALQEVEVRRSGFAPATLQALRYLLVPAAAAGGGGGDALPPGGPAACERAADAETERRIALVLVHACQQELAALGTTLQQDQQRAAARQVGARRGGGATGGGTEVAEAQAAAAAFRIEKKKVLLACLDQLTGGAAPASGGGGGNGPGGPGGPAPEQRTAEPAGAARQ